jgi:hypothetical protein
MTTRHGDGDATIKLPDDKLEGAVIGPAICVSLDGWHYSRSMLDGFEDPVNAHWRRVRLHTRVMLTS